MFIMNEVRKNIRTYYCFINRKVFLLLKLSIHIVLNSLHIILKHVANKFTSYSHYDHCRNIKFSFTHWNHFLLWQKYWLAVLSSGLKSCHAAFPFSLGHWRRKGSLLFLVWYGRSLARSSLIMLLWLRSSPGRDCPQKPQSVWARHIDTSGQIRIGHKKESNFCEN